MTERNDAAAVTTDASPVPGTHFHARRLGRRNLPPEYRGPGGLSAACAEARLHGMTHFEWGGLLYKYVRGYWHSSRPREVPHPPPTVVVRAEPRRRGGEEVLKSLFAEYERHGGEA